MIFTIAFLWFVSLFKSLSFWIYLWQLKDYHTGRFIDHFSTEKGKSILKNPTLIAKITFLPLIWFIPGLWVLLAFLYFFELLLAFKRKGVLKPVFTLKTFSLTLLGIFAMVVFISSVYLLNTFVFWLLLFDVVSPIIFSAIILAFQPVAVFQRNRIIAKAKRKRKDFGDLIVVGITGSYGKTSTKEYLAHILSKKFEVLKTKEHQNSEIGVSRAILEDLNKKHQVFVCEMGAYNRGGIKLLADIAKPSIGVICGINEQHMATFGSQDNIIKAKFELIDSLPKGGVAVLNKDSEKVKKENILSHNKGLAKVIWCSLLQKSDVTATNIKYSKKGVEFTLNSKERISVPVNNIQNILLAVGVAQELGMSLKEIKNALNNLSNGLNVSLKNGITVINSSYSANPNGVISDLEYLKLFDGPKLVIMPSLIELGKSSSRVHERIGKKISEVCALGIITTKDKYDDVKKGGGDAIVYLDNPRDIMQKVKDMGIKTILLEGRSSSKIISLFA